MISLHQRLWGLWSPPTTDFAGKGTNNVMEIKLTEKNKTTEIPIIFLSIDNQANKKGLTETILPSTLSAVNSCQ
jgi:hypothetical protein